MKIFVSVTIYPWQVSVTNVVSAPAINKIGSLFNSLNKTVTGALNSIITGAPVAPGGAQLQPVSSALSPLPAWRVPAARPLAAFPDQFPLQRFQPPPPPLPGGPQRPPVMRAIGYETQQHQHQLQQQPYQQLPPHSTVPSGVVYRPAFDAYQPPPRVPYKTLQAWRSI